MTEPTGEWSLVEIAGRAVEVFSPAGREPTAAAIFLHGYDEQSFRGREAFERAFADAGLMVVCPPGGRTWWLDRPAEGFDDVTPAGFVTGPLREWLTSEHGFPATAQGLTGIGMGGAGAVGIAFRHALRWHVVAAMSPDLDFHQWVGQGTPLDRLFSSQEEARQETPILHIHPLNWPRHMLFVCDPADLACFEGTDRLLSKLRSSGIPYESDLTTTAGGHTWDYFDLQAAKVATFLAERLSR